MTIAIYNYGGGSSPSSQIKAMCVDLGEYTLYFSYETLIAFANEDVVFVTKKSYSNTTQTHKASIRYVKKRLEVKQELLHLLIYTNVLGLSYKEALEKCKKK